MVEDRKKAFEPFGVDTRFYEFATMDEMMFETLLLGAKTKFEKAVAAFESEKAPVIKGPSDTLQGFALLLFFGSFFALLCILPIKVYLVTQDLTKTGIAFGGLFFLGIMFTGLIQRFA